MLTLFAIPKPFDDPFTALIQRNAILSWVALGAEVILCGQDSGVGDAARELGARHLPGLAVNEFGTPLLNSAFEQVQRTAQHDLICYANADIILFPDLPAALRSLALPRFLLAGERIDLDWSRPIDCRTAGWQTEVRQAAEAYGRSHGPGAMDYFAFRRGTIQSMPPFAVGRPGWDNWLVFKMRQLGVPVVDGSAAVTAIHQNHDYAHVAGRRGPQWQGPEGDENYRLASEMPPIHCHIHDATHVLVGSSVREAAQEPYVSRRLDREPFLSRRSTPGELLRSKTLWGLYRVRRALPARLWNQIVYRLAP